MAYKAFHNNEPEDAYPLMVFQATEPDTMYLQQSMQQTPKNLGKQLINMGRSVEKQDLFTSKNG